MSAAEAYRPDIDGLRAVAVLAVVLFHAELGVKGGFVGVDVFFVISGYLITSLILRDLQRNTFSLADFWERRFRRILPACVFVVIATFLAGLFILLPGDATRLSEALIAQSVFLSNVHAWRNAGYFGPAAETVPLLHLWSLAIEEQFYFFFPLAMWLMRRLQRRWLILAIGFAALCSFALSVYGANRGSSFTFYMLPTRAWELMAGCILAMIPAPHFERPQLQQAIGLAGLATILLACVSYDSLTPFPGLAALAPCLGAAAVIWSGSVGSTISRRMLAWKPLVAIGLCSYSLYLWHWPVLVYAKYWSLETLPLPVRLFLVAITFVLAFLTLHYIERPFRQKRILASSRPLFKAAFGTMAFLMMVGFAGTQVDLVSHRFHPRLMAIFETIESESDYASDQVEDLTLAEIRQGIFHELTPELSNQPIGCLVWGDSTSRALCAPFQTLGKSHCVRTVAAVRVATPPILGFGRSGITRIPDYTVSYNAEVVKQIIKQKIPHVVMSCNWIGYDPLNRKKLPTSSMQACLHRTILELKNAGATVWLLEPPPRQQKDTRRQVALAFTPETHRLSGVTYEAHTRLQADAYQMLNAMTNEGARLIDPSSLLDDGKGRYLLIVNKTPLYRDGWHLSRQGAIYIKRAFEPVFRLSAQQMASRSPKRL